MEEQPKSKGKKGSTTKAAEIEIEPVAVEPEPVTEESAKVKGKKDAKAKPVDVETVRKLLCRISFYRIVS